MPATPTDEISALMDSLELQRVELAESMAMRLHAETTELERLALLHEAIVSLAEAAAYARKLRRSAA